MGRKKYAINGMCCLLIPGVWGICVWGNSCHSEWRCRSGAHTELLCRGMTTTTITACFHTKTNYCQHSYTSLSFSLSGSLSLHLSSIPHLAAQTADKQPIHPGHIWRRRKNKREKARKKNREREKQAEERERKFPQYLEGRRAEFRMIEREARIPLVLLSPSVL